MADEQHMDAFFCWYVLGLACCMLNSAMVTLLPTIWGDPFYIGTMRCQCAELRNVAFICLELIFGGEFSKTCNTPLNSLT